MLNRKEASELATLVGNNGKLDDYEFLQTLKFKKPPERKILFDFFELSIPVEDIKELLPSLEDVSPEFGLFNHQARALRQVEFYLNEEPCRTLLHMPTGSGKTRTAMEIIADSFNRNKEGCLIFWLVYSEELCEQAVECFLDIWKHVGNKNVKLIRAWGRNNLSPLDEEKFAFVVGGFQKLFLQLQKNPELFEFRTLSCIVGLTKLYCC